MADQEVSTVRAAINIERARVLAVFVGAELAQTLIRRPPAAVFGFSAAGLIVTGIGAHKGRPNKRDNILLPPTAPRRFRRALSSKAGARRVRKIVIFRA